MFLLVLEVERIDAEGNASPVPLRRLDDFAMRNFTNDAVFDDTLPIADGLLEAGLLVPLDRLNTAMDAWFRRRQFLQTGETLRITVRPATPAAASSEA